MKYFSYLASRALGQLPVVQPYLTSRFEPLKVESGPVTRSQIEYATFTPNTPSANDAAPVRDQSPFPASDRQEDRRPAESILSQTFIHWVPEIAHEAPLHVIDRPVAPIPVDPPEIHRQPVEDSLKEQIVLETTSETIVHSMERHVEQEKVIEHTHVIERVPERDRTITPILPAIEPAKLHPMLATPRVTAYLPPEPASIEEAVPVIHVNIGRIEVRAIHTGLPAASKPPMTSKPKLSLDQYLRGESK